MRDWTVELYLMPWHDQLAVPVISDHDEAMVGVAYPCSQLFVRLYL
jgi:hypothetical protein